MLSSKIITQLTNMKYSSKNGKMAAAVDLLTKQKTHKRGIMSNFYPSAGIRVN